MEENTVLTIAEFCEHYDIPVSFFDKLEEYELVEIQEENSIKHIKAYQINKIEKIIRLHFDLNINFEGLDVILNLLNRINELEQENNYLKKKLQFYL